MTGREVFEILAGTHAPMLRAYLYSVLRSPQDADDLYQETLVAAWKSLPSYDRARPFAPWLRGIAFRVVSDWRRSRRPLVCDEATLQLVDRRFEKLDGQEEKFAALRECLKELDSDDRQVIDLRYQRGQACGTIAHSLQRGVEWVKKRLQRARAALAICVEGKIS